MGALYAVTIYRKQDGPKYGAECACWGDKVARHVYVSYNKESFCVTKAAAICRIDMKLSA